MTDPLHSPEPQFDLSRHMARIDRELAKLERSSGNLARGEWLTLLGIMAAGAMCSAAGAIFMFLVR